MPTRLYKAAITIVSIGALLTGAAYYWTEHQAKNGSPERIVVVDGAAGAVESQDVGLVVSGAPSRAADPKVQRLMTRLKSDHPFIDHVDVICDAGRCALDAKLKDLSTAEQFDQFERQIDTSIKEAIERGDVGTHGPVVIDMMGGAYTGFHVDLVP